MADENAERLRASMELELKLIKEKLDRMVELARQQVEAGRKAIESFQEGASGSSTNNDETNVDPGTVDPL